MEHQNIDGTDIAREIWNHRHKCYERDCIPYDDWLETFEQEISLCKSPIIDLGCGSGNDTKYLIEHGKQVIPCDYTENAIVNIKKNFPEVSRTECCDMRDGLPFEGSFTDLIIADLSLHYFSKEMTEKIILEFKRVLRKDGTLLFRVNSINDVNHGAGKGLEIEKHYYQTANGVYKRFFDESDIRMFFKDWDIFYIENEKMYRYEEPKDLWKVAVKSK